MHFRNKIGTADTYEMVNREAYLMLIKEFDKSSM